MGRTAYVECDADNYDSWGLERREFYWLDKSVIDGGTEIERRWKFCLVFFIKRK